jgi:hypothetical protein
LSKAAETPLGRVPAASSTAPEYPFGATLTCTVVVARSWVLTVIWSTVTPRFAGGGEPLPVPPELLVLPPELAVAPLLLPPELPVLPPELAVAPLLLPPLPPDEPVAPLPLLDPDAEGSPVPPEPAPVVRW